MAEAQKYLFRGERRTVNEIMALTGGSQMTILRRRRGDRVIDEAEARAIDRQQKMKPKPIGPKAHSVYETADGKTLSLKGWAAELEIPYNTLRAWRWQLGMSMEEIVEKVRTDYEPRLDLRKLPLVDPSYNEVQE